jgi:hypothetical protein
MDIKRELVALNESLWNDQEYFVSHDRDGVVGEYVILEHVSRRGIATVRVCGLKPITGGSRHDIKVDSFYWFTDLI